MPGETPKEALSKLLASIRAAIPTTRLVVADAGDLVVACVRAGKFRVLGHTRRSRDVI